MTFNSNSSKQAQEVIFSRIFNNNNVSQVSSQKHLGVILDVELKFEEHLKNVFNKAN